MAWRTISVALTASTSGYTAGLSSAARQTATFGKQTDAVQKKSSSGWSKAGKGAAIGIALVGAALGASLKEAISWESAFAGVRKTVDGSEAEFKALEDGLLGMATRLPQSREEIAGVAEAAGQLGIAKGDILGFTEVMVNLGTATNLSSEEAATGLAQFANIMQTSAADYERLGSTLVDLGNKGASTESDILAMSLRLAGAGQVIGLSEADVLSLSNAMASMGIQSELGGGAFSRTMLKVYDAVKSGGDELESFGEVAGMSGDKFAAMFESDPAAALDAVVVGLGNAKDSGANMVTVLEDLGIKGTQERQVMLRLAGAGDLLTESLENGKTAWSENTALADEAAERYKTAASKLKVFGNQVTDVARQAGAELIPVLLGSLEAAQDFGAWMADAGAAAGSALSGTWDDLASAGESLIDILGYGWDVASPFLDVLVQVGGGIVIGGFMALADVLERVTGFLADNEAATKAAMTVLIAYGAVQAFPLLIKGASTLADHMYLIANVTKGSAAVGWAKGMAGQLKLAAIGAANMASGISGGAAQMKSGLMGAAGLIGPLGFALAGIGIVGYLGMSKVKKGADEARKKIKEMMAGLDSKSMKGLDHLERQLRSMSSQSYSSLDQVMGLFTSTKSEEYDKAAGKVADALDEVKSKYKDAQTALSEDLGLNLSIDAIERFAQAADIDVNALDTKDFTEAIVEAKTAATETTPALQNVKGAVADIGNEAASAEDQVQGFKDILDQLIDKPKSLFDTSTAYQEGIQSLTAAVAEYGFSLDGMTEGGGKVRSALSGLVDDAHSSADALLDNGFSAEAAAEALKGAETNIRDLAEAAGFTGDPLEALLEDLGLYDGTYEALLQAEAGDAEAAVAAATTDVQEFAKQSATAYLDLDDTSARTVLNLIDVGLTDYITSDPKAQAFLEISDPVARKAELDRIAGGWIMSDPTAIGYFNTLDPQAKQAVLNAIAQKWGGARPTAVAGLDSSRAWAELARLENYRPPSISIPIYAQRMGDWANLGSNYGGGAARNGDGRWGRVHAFAKGGVTAHVQKGEMFRYAEPETGGEALIPRLGDRRRNMQILRIAAGWNNAEVVPRTSVFARGGVTTPQLFPIRSAGGGGISVSMPVEVKVMANGDEGVASIVRRELVPAIKGQTDRVVKILDRYGESH